MALVSLHPIPIAATYQEFVTRQALCSTRCGYPFILSSRQLSVVPVSVPISQMRKARHGEVPQFVQGHTQVGEKLGFDLVLSDTKTCDLCHHVALR